ncbi:cytochrome P450 [Amycolatopsis sp. PS_44_ISF1]|uniref:cytochrome P450 n=1 Tax=Amycolatopsis sp. PS_44_ISF1 TaxID=2974917 RepID=UPI0028DE7574|nr:cytochrome P450 [Amycolatopsis sp. PS_44_ISF1]MDT8912863.1 cytochrome P450 [Amycolatopsis sp. PS_44_ISF1]
MAESVEQILANIDLYAEDQRENLLAAVAAARTRCPVLHTGADGGYHVLTRYEDVRAVCADPARFSSRQPSLRGVPVRVIPIDTDPPHHRRYRRILNPYFSPDFLRRCEPQLRELARTAVASFANEGGCEVVQDFAVPFSAGSLARVVFATENRDLVARGVAAAEQAALTSSPEAFRALAGLAAEALAEAEGATGEDTVLRALATATVDGRPLTPQERLGMVTTLFLGGLDTTRGVIANIACHLATRPDVEPILRRPGGWRRELEEFLRYETTVAFMARTAVEDTEIGGVPVRAGDRIAVLFAAANRDPAWFDRPDELVFDRPDGPHLAFGFGVHRCLGLHFARLQLAIAFEELLARTTNFRLAPGTGIPRQAGLSLNSPHRLDVVFDARPVSGRRSGPLRT